MPFTLETGNKHKDKVFKQFKANDQDFEHTFALHAVYRQHEGFEQQCLLSKDFKLLSFVETGDLSELETVSPLTIVGIMPQHEPQLTKNYAIYSPQSIELVPYSLATDTLLKTDNQALYMHESVVNFFDQKIKLRCLHDKKIQTQYEAISTVEAILKIYPSGKIACVKPCSMFLFKAKEKFHLVLIHEQKLLFANSFEGIEKENMLYFMLATIKDLRIKQEETELFYLETEFDEKQVKFWKSYLPQTTCLEDQLPYPKVKGDIAFSLRPYALLFQPLVCE